LISPVLPVVRAESALWDCFCHVPIVGGTTDKSTGLYPGPHLRLYS
jgi:hypothetical protein